MSENWGFIMKILFILIMNMKEMNYVTMQILGSSTKNDKLNMGKL